jgi:1,4-alpha-glucan branching enzyme/maltooligosyltrehalose trehalohydrolase
LERVKHARWLEYTRSLLRLRREQIVPRLYGVKGHAAEASTWGTAGLQVSWALGDGSTLALLANLDDEPAEGTARPPGALLFESTPGLAAGSEQDALPPWSVMWFLQPGS